MKSAWAAMLVSLLAAAALPAKAAPGDGWDGVWSPIENNMFDPQWRPQGPQLRPRIPTL